MCHDQTKANAEVTCFQSNAAQGPIHSSAAQPSRRAHLLCNYTKHKHLKLEISSGYMYRTVESNSVLSNNRAL